MDCLEGECVAYTCISVCVSVLAYLSSMRWPCIYSRCSTSWMVTRIRSHWMGYFLLLSVSDLVKDIERTVYLG